MHENQHNLEVCFVLLKCILRELPWYRWIISLLGLSWSSHTAM